MTDPVDDPAVGPGRRWPPRFLALRERSAQVVPTPRGGGVLRGLDNASMISEPGTCLGGARVSG
jgi:hypothetical protein